MTAFRSVNLRRFGRDQFWTFPGVAAIAIRLFVGRSFFVPTSVRAPALPADPVRSQPIDPGLST